MSVSENQTTFECMLYNNPLLSKMVHKGRVHITKMYIEIC